MRFCNVERQDFPDREFKADEQGVLMHYPAGDGPPHPVEAVGPWHAPEVPFDIVPDDLP